jgi:hypothetical protein
MPRECSLFISVAGPTQAEFLEGYFIPSIYLCLALELMTETMRIYIYIYIYICVCVCVYTQIKEGK